MKNKSIIISVIITLFLVLISFVVYVIKQSDKFESECTLNSWILDYTGPKCHGYEFSTDKEVIDSKGETWIFPKKYCIGYWTCD